MGALMTNSGRALSKCFTRRLYLRHPFTARAVAFLQTANPEPRVPKRAPSPEPRAPHMHAFRTLRTSPGFALTAILTLALGIGLATAVFTVADALLLRRLPLRDQDGPVVLWSQAPDRGFDYPFTLDEERQFARRTRSLTQVAFFGYEGAWPRPIRDGERISRLRAALVSGEFFDVLGAQPVLGRALHAGDDVVGAAPVVVLSHGIWQRQFGGDAKVLGRPIVTYGTGVVHALPGLVLGETRPALIAFAAAAGLLLLITCINVANLLLVRGLARVREIAVRSALGAGQPQVVRQLLAENALLALAGGALGVVVAAAAVRSFVAVAPAGLPRLDEIQLNTSALAGAVGITGVAMLLFGLAPAVITSRVGIEPVLRSGTRQSASRRSGLGTVSLRPKDSPPNRPPLTRCSTWRS